MEINSEKQGVYFMSNNKVVDLTIAFLNSFRMHNKDLPLCLIPYDNECNKIEELQNIYNFNIFTKKDLLNKCDAISIEFHGNIVGAYRKLVAWEGDFEQFIYIDIDTVVLDNLSFVWANLIHCKIFTSHSNLPHIRKWVWKDSIYIKNKLNISQIQFAANTGFIVSSKKTLPMNWVIDQVDKALALKEDMELFCMEQPFLNYLFVTSGYNYGSLLQFARTNINKGTDRKIKFEYWAGTPGAKINKGKLSDSTQRPFFLVHWAGVWQQDDGKLTTLPYKNLWEYYRNLDPFNLPEPEYKIKLSILQKLSMLLKN